MATSAVSSNQKTIEQIMKSTADGANSRKTGELGKDDFLNLLVTQLKYQDPLNPVNDKEFIGQMAQFSSLEQMQNMNNSFSATKAFNLIGKRVLASIVDDKTKETKTIEGEVSSVKMSAGKTYVVVNGKDVPVDSVTDVTQGFGFNGTNLSAYTNLIGYNADGYAYDSSNGKVVAVSGTVKSVQKGAYEDYAVMDGVNVQISEIVSNIKSTDPKFMENYLKSNDGKEVEVYIKDSKTDTTVPVKATLRAGSLKIGNGKITAILDKVLVPVDSISNVTPAAKQASTEETLLKQILEKLSQNTAPASNNNNDNNDNSSTDGPGTEGE